jgi:tetratricopeptide (TPR) repeat protein
MRKSVLFLSSLCVVAATALAASSRDAEVLMQAQKWQLEFRQGNIDVAKPLVKTLEDAVARSDQNARLWEAMGHAYMARQGSMFAGPPDMAALIAVGEKARAAYERSLAIAPNDPLVRASHGMSQMVVSQLKGDGPGIVAGVEEMNAAVRQAPKSSRVRLTRGFTIIHLPPAMRDTDAVIEDLGHVLDDAPGGRPEDVLHLMLGDVHAEMGRLDAARAEYEQITGASAFAAEQVKQRFADLKTGAITPASIALVRAGTGTRCAMCHAPGTDN